ncbi:MAG: hypothetical protein BGP04_03855 [Rhizobiales bacterium 62-17]|jgi:uncharacterized membrane protein HdeD (DUF308 family)|nr:HdeD family acid-resistance protein [Hyphomicrobiales bacterium]OJY04528.1 MAG: hypothetical protein BGP04_03855 [Rhizobiales bacterium 62-17]HEV2572075.1 HdeD family acid-resistance protein [Beijerinckiaceae bacterium]
MTDASSASPNPQPTIPAPFDLLKAKWGWIVALGVVYAIAGVVALGSVVMATVVSVLIVGFMMILSGVFEIINSFQFKSWGKFILWFLLGLLYIASGVICYLNPLLAAAALTLMLGISLIVSGVLRIILAFNMKSESPWIWVGLSGVLTVVLGAILLSGWPLSGLYALGIFLGIDLIFAGAAWIGLGLAARSKQA